MKKKVIITVSIIVLVIAAVIAVGAFMLFGNAEKPGVEYDSNDVKDVIDNIGIKPEENEKGETVEQTVERLKSEGKVIGRDYTVEYSDFKEKTFELTSEQLTALVNELMPSVTFISNSQLKLEGGNRITVYAELDTYEVLEKAFPDKSVTGLPEKVKFSATGDITVKDNKATFKPENISSPIIEKLALSQSDELKVNLSSLFSKTPDLRITSVEQTENGTITITGTVPQSLRIVEF
ncbi:MAG: hypothetical protein IKT65_05845 [Clostridia bacterium]|nr:hypothetical protein [Clostridia bacterium]